MLLQDKRYGDFDTTSPVLLQALAQMDQWLTTLSRDASTDTPIVKLRRAKPADLVDCMLEHRRNTRRASSRSFSTVRVSAMSSIPLSRIRAALRGRRSRTT